MKASLFNKNFLKDLKLPVAVDKDPYFSHYMNLVDPYFSSLDKYQTFVQCFENHGRELFFDNNRRLVNATLDYLKDKPAFEVFNNIDIKQFKKDIQISGQELYKSHNQNKHFISIDLVKANFQSLLFVVPDLFDGHTNYDDFVKSRGFNDFMVISKQIRQILFGNMNPQRQQKIQSFMMNQIADILVLNGISVSDIYSLSSDELVFENVDDNHTVFDVVSVLMPLGFDVRVEAFKLVRPFEKPFYVKELQDGTKSFKMVPTSVMAEFIKRLENRPVEDIDLYFYDETGRLSKHVEPFID